MLTRLWNLFRRRQLDREFDVELRHHLESLEAEHRARGLTPGQARLAARRDLGGIARTREAYRDQRGIPMLETLWNDIRFSLRSLRRTPVVTLAAVVTLALGIGANTAVFSVVNGVLIKPLPFPGSDRLITVAHAAPGIVLSDSSDVSSSPFLYFTEREQNQTLEGVGLVGQGTATVTGQGEPELIQRVFATSDVLPLLGIPPLIGRYFTDDEDTAGGPNLVVLSYGYWQRRFGGDPSALGAVLTMNNEAWEIIGVTPQRFRFLGRQVDVITPYGLDRSGVMLGGYFRPSIARLKPGATLEQASADIARLIPIAINSFPPIPGSSREQTQSARLTPALRPLKQDVVGDAGNILWVLMGTIAMVLLIACANIANLLLVRTEGRQQELSIRAALGAGRARIARELFTESAILSLAGGALGVALAYACLRVLLTIAPANLPRMDEITIDTAVLLFAFGVSVFSGLLFGIIPVVRYSRPRVAQALVTGGRWFSAGRERLRARGTLVAAQVALALVLLISAGLMIRSFQQLNNVNPGFSGPAEVQTFQIQILASAQPDPELLVRRQNQILDRLAALPGVTAAGFTSAVPMGGGYTADLVFPEGKQLREGQRPSARQFRFASPGLFSTLGVPLVAGRDFNWTDVYGKRPVVLVSENLARLEWGSLQQALGKRLRGSSPKDQWREIVGVVGEVRDQGLGRPVLETVYAPALAERIFNTATFASRSVTYAIRSARTGNPGFLDEIRQAVWAIDPDLPLINVRTMGDLVSGSVARTSFTLVMLALAGAMALLLGMIGIYGVLSYAVSQRTREVGIRMALGAQGAEVRAMFVRQGLAMTAAGVAVGLLGAVALTRWMAALLFEVSPLDPLTYAAVSVLLLAAAALAAYLPSRRATRVDPVEALRAE